MNDPIQEQPRGAGTDKPIFRCSTLLCGKPAAFHRPKASVPRPKCATCFVRNVMRGSQSYKIAEWDVITPNTMLSVDGEPKGKDD